jgi:hydroxyacylglutathione hydrolase
VALQIELLPFSQDNYAFVFKESHSNKVVAVDPGEAQCVDRFLRENNLSLDVILNTHHHPDHVGGNLELQEIYDCAIYGYNPDRSRIPGITRGLDDEETFNIGQSHWQTIFVPGHTLGHIAFFCADEKVLFCGDTLFSLGCGRLFEGTPKQMLQSLVKLSQLPTDTKIYCAHEYTLKNAEFALQFESNNPDLIEMVHRAQQLRSQKQPTVPTVLSDELQCNPFLRTHSDDIRKSLNDTNGSDLEIFAKLRELKDSF